MASEGILNVNTRCFDAALVYLQQDHNVQITPLQNLYQYWVCPGTFFVLFCFVTWTWQLGFTSCQASSDSCAVSFLKACGLLGHYLNAVCPFQTFAAKICITALHKNALKKANFSWSCHARLSLTQQSQYHHHTLRWLSYSPFILHSLW